MQNRPTPVDFVRIISQLIGMSATPPMGVTNAFLQATKGTPLHAWRPGKADNMPLREALGAVARVCAKPAAVRDLASLDKAFDHPGSEWAELKRLAMEHLKSAPEPVAHQRTGPTTGGQAASAQNPRQISLPADNQPTPARKPAYKPRPAKKPASNRRGKLREALAPWPVPEDLNLKAADVCTIYMDETWPASERYGVIAGLLWRGEKPNQAILPLVRQHLRSRYGSIKYGKLPASRFAAAAAKVLGALRKAKEYCTPFIFRFTPPENVARELAYEQMVYDGLLLLLGWIAPIANAHTPLRIRVLCEAIDGYGFPDGMDQTEKFSGILIQAGRNSPTRFGAYRLEQLLWRQKIEGSPEKFSPSEIEGQGYLGYADLLAFLTAEAESEKARAAAALVDVKSLATYLQIDAGTFTMLDRLEQSSGRELGPVLDFLVNNSLHVLGAPDNVVINTVIERTRARIAKDPRLAKDLLEILNSRYMAKQRDLRQLDRQFSVVKRLVETVPDNVGIELQLLDLASDLQRSNHFGDPLALRIVEERYQSLRRRALDNGHADLVAHVDLNLAVQARDRFQPEAARAISQRLLSEEARFSLLSRAKACSSLGQDQCLLGDSCGARLAFDRALALVGQAELDEASKAGEWDQTAIYRAIAAMDAGAADSVALVEEILTKAGLGTLPQSAARLAADCSTKHAYRHHLLLRLLHARPDLSADREAYLAAMTPEVRDQHPYELICLYRALMVHAMGGDARPHLRKGIEIASVCSHGATLRAIAAMLATLGWALLMDAEFRSEGRRIILGVPEALVPIKPLEEVLPTARPMILVWLEILGRDAPHQADIGRALGQLKFNYR